jgi:hypothetical protein
MTLESLRQSYLHPAFLTGASLPLQQYIKLGYICSNRATPVARFEHLDLQRIVLGIVL